MKSLVEVVRFGYGLAVASDISIRSWWSDGRLVSAPLYPHRRILVPTESIRQKSKGREIAGRDERYCYVRGGDWDVDTYDFQDVPPFEAMRDHFVNGTPWEETELYRRTIDGDIDPIWSSCATRQDVDARLASLDRLYKRMQTHGFVSRKEMGTNGVPPASHRYRDDIRVNVGRSGDFIHKNGKHRLGIAKILGIAEVPVVIVVRHAEWQRLRGLVYKAKTVEAAGEDKRFRNHPDLSNLVVESE